MQMPLVAGPAKFERVFLCDTGATRLSRLNVVGHLASAVQAQRIRHSSKQAVVHTSWAGTTEMGLACGSHPNSVAMAQAGRSAQRVWDNVSISSFPRTASDGRGIAAARRARSVGALTLFVQKRSQAPRRSRGGAAAAAASGAAACATCGAVARLLAVELPHRGGRAHIPTLPRKRTHAPVWICAEAATTRSNMSGAAATRNALDRRDRIRPGVPCRRGQGANLCQEVPTRCESPR